MNKLRYLFSGKKGIEKSKIFRPFSDKKGKQKLEIFGSLFSGKKGMETWQLMLMILAILLLLFFITWYGLLKGQLGDLLEKLGEIL